MTFEEFSMAPELADLVQKNTDRYRLKWEAMHRKTLSVEKMAATMSWSWPGFLLSGPWLFYRKMYLEGATWAVAIILLTVAENITGKSLNAGTLGLCIAVGMYGNGWYFKHTYKRLTAMRGGDQFSAKAGGTSWPATIVASLATAIVVILLSVPEAGWTAFRKGYDEADQAPPATSAQHETATDATPAQNPSAAAFEPAGAYAYREPGMAGELVLIPTGDGGYQVRVETADPQTGNSCEIGTDNKDPLRVVPRRPPGTSLAVFNWNEKAVEGCAFELQVEPGSATLSTAHTNCFGLCGQGVDVSGVYVKKQN